MAVTPTDLSGTERAVLLVLMAKSGPVPNPDLFALGHKLGKPSRLKLNDLGLIESYTENRRIVHELTDKGWHLCRDIVAADPPPRSTGPAKTLYTVLRSLGRYLTSADLSLADVFGNSDDAPATAALDERIRSFGQGDGPGEAGLVPGEGRLRCGNFYVATEGQAHYRAVVSGVSPASSL